MSEREQIAKSAWDEAWKVAFDDGRQAGQPFGYPFLDRDKEWLDSDARRAALASSNAQADGGKGETGVFVFPPMPPAVVVHDKVGPLFDRLSMHFYASKCMSLIAPQAECAPREALLEALQKIAAIENKMVGGDWDEIEEARTIALDAIEQAAKEKA
jgi:hypothetical protein